MAQAIVEDRMKNGPFQSIFDLNRVVDSANGAFIADDSLPTTVPLSTTAQQLLGDLAYYGGTNTATPMVDFKYRYLNLTRLSNLITTRSDTFTVYGVVEGWQNAGMGLANTTNPPTLVVTRRFAFIVDANGLTPSSRAMRTVAVPTN